jgi:hypothetical protein
MFVALLASKKVILATRNFLTSHFPFPLYQQPQINTHNFNWWNSDHRDALRTNASFFPTPPNVSTLYQDVIEAPHDIQSVNGDM